MRVRISQRDCAQRSGSRVLAGPSPDVSCSVRFGLALSALRHERWRVCPVWFLAAWRFRLPQPSSDSSTRATAPDSPARRRPSIHPPVACCSHPCVATPANRFAQRLQYVTGGFSAFLGGSRSASCVSFFSSARNPVLRNLCVINACAHNVDLLLLLAGDASARLGVPGHACPFIGRQPVLRLRSYLRRFIRPLFWLAFNFFVERPMARRRATSSPAWGG